MYKASNSYLESASALSRESRSKIVLDGKTYDGSKYIKTYPKFSHENEKMIGGFPIKSCSFEFWIKEEYVDFENKEFEVYKGLIINDSIEWIPQGVFKASVEDIKSSDSGLYLTITGYDRAKEAGTILFEDPNEYPCNSLIWIKKSLLKYGYELENENFPHNDVITEKPNYLETTYLREAISRYAEIRGCIALFSRTGKIEIKRPTETGLKYYFYQYYKLTKEKQFGTIDMAVLGRKNINNDITYPSVQDFPSPKFEWRIEDNPFVDLVREQTVEFVYNNLKNLSIIPFEAINLLDNFLLDINDIVEIQTKDGSWMKTTILSVQTENRIRCTIKAGVQNKTTSDYPLAGSTKESIKKVQLDVDHNSQRIEALASEVNQYDEKINTLEMTVDSTILNINHKYDFLREEEGKNQLKLDNSLEYQPIEFSLNGHTKSPVYLFPIGNLFEKEKLILKTGIAVASGSISTQEAWDLTNFIEVVQNENYCINKAFIGGTNNFGICFYDNNKIFLIGKSWNTLGYKQNKEYEQITFNIPNNAKYIRINLRTDTNINILRIEKGKNISGIDLYPSDDLYPLGLIEGSCE